MRLRASVGRAGAGGRGRCRLREACRGPGRGLIDRGAQGGGVIAGSGGLAERGCEVNCRLNFNQRLPSDHSPCGT